MCWSILWRKSSRMNSIWARHQLASSTAIGPSPHLQIRTLTPFGFSQIGWGSLFEIYAKFIRDKSGVRLARVLQLTLKIAKYSPFEGRGWQPLPEFLTKTKSIINIRNNDERCFGYALLYFLERENLPEQNCFRTTLQRHYVLASPSRHTSLP